MTISANDRRKEYAGNGITTTFSGPRAFAASHIAVSLVDDATGVATPTTAYTLGNVGVRNRQTSVVMNAAPAAGVTLLILRTVPIEQATSITNQGAYLPGVVEDMADALAQQAQQIGERADRSAHFADDLVLPEGTLAELPAPAPSSVFAWDASGTRLENRPYPPPPVEPVTVARPGAEMAQVLRDMRDGLAVKIVCVGDSLTYGQLDTGGQALAPWPDRLQAVLREYYANSNITVINKGVGGSTVAAMLSRFATDVTDEAPRLVLFNGGTNDCREANGVSLAAYRSNVELMLSRLGSTPVIVWGLPPRYKEQRSDNGEGVVQFYRDVLRESAVSRGLRYVDTFARMNSLYKSRAAAAGALSADGSHYSEAGYRYLADVLFVDGFANDDLCIRPGEFKDARGQWIVTGAAESAWGGGDLQDADALVLNNSSVKLYLFVDEWVESALVLHTVINNTSGDTTGAVSVSHNSLVSGGSVIVNLSPGLAGGTSFFINDYAIPTVRLRAGLNSVTLSTSTVARLCGFSVLPTAGRQYLPTIALGDRDRSREFWTAARYQVGTQSYEYLRSGTLVVSNSASLFVEPYFQITPDPTYQTSRWRFRATVVPGAAFYFGQQTNAAGSYAYVYSLTLNGTSAIVKVRDHAGVESTAATVAVAVLAGGTNLVIDLKTTASGWSLWIGGVLVFSDTVPLCLGPVFVSAPSADRIYLNPPIKKGQSASDTGVLVGETWQTFTDDKLHIINKSAAEKTLTFV